MKKTLLITLLIIFGATTAIAQYGGALRRVKPQAVINCASSDEIQKLEKDGWFEVTSFFYPFPNSNDSDYTAQIRTWVKSSKRGKASMFSAIILDEVYNHQRDKSEKIVTINGDYGNLTYDSKIEGKHSHKFINGNRTFYLDLSGVTVEDSDDNDMIFMALLIGISSIFVGMIFLIYSKTRKTNNN